MPYKSSNYCWLVAFMIPSVLPADQSLRFEIPTNGWQAFEDTGQIHLVGNGNRRVREGEKERYRMFGYAVWNEYSGIYG